MRLRRLILAGEYGIVHCHGTWDHIVAYWALKGRRASVPLVRTDHGARDYRRGMFRVFFYGPRMTDHLIVLSDRYVVQAVNRMGRDPQSTTAVRGAVDTDLYRPMDAPAGLRERLALAPGDVVFGLVARIQRHRRFDVLLEAAAIAHGRDPRVRVVVLGRGTLRKQILDIPAARMGLQGVVLPLGYRTDDYREVLSALDAGLMLAPGSDGSCRAALQIASMGKPLIVVERGTLPDIVRDGETGIVTHCTPEALAEAMLEVASDAGRRQQSGRAGRERMRRLFTLSRQTDRVEDVYRRLLAARRAGSAL
jgi:glycosyltransferase involved in cell wall biosynthesis